MSGKFSRDKGGRNERAVVHKMRDVGFAAERVPLSGGAAGKFGRYAGDVSFPLLGIDRTIEVKIRADGFKQIYDWKSNHFALVIGADRKQKMIVLELEAFLGIAMLADKNFKAQSLIDLVTKEEGEDSGA